MNQKRKDQILALSERLKQLQAQQTKAESRQRAKVARRSRKEDLRRKILAGAVALACVEDGRLSKTDFYAWLDGALEDSEDRALFGLEARAERSAGDGASLVETPLAHVVADSQEQVRDRTE